MSQSLVTGDTLPLETVVLLEAHHPEIHHIEILVRDSHEKTIIAQDALPVQFGARPLHRVDILLFRPADPRLQ